MAARRAGTQGDAARRLPKRRISRRACVLLERVGDRRPRYRRWRLRMQLKKSNSLRQALAVATCGLFTAAPTIHAEGEIPVGKWEIDSSLLYYSEQDRVRAFRSEE